MAEHGEIYVLVNQAMPGLVKVGKTRGGAALRASQLSGATGIPEDFEVVRACEVLDVDAAERLAHMVLAKTNGRPNNHREFFLGPVEKVIEILNEALRRFVPAGDDMPQAWRIGLDKASSGQPGLALAQFEYAISKGEAPVASCWLSSDVLEALGAYSACCCFLGREPKLLHLFTDPQYRHPITEGMIKFLALYQVDDPQTRAVHFMRGLT